MEWKIGKYDVQTAQDARELAIQWQASIGEQDMSMSEFQEWFAYFEELAERFPELREEFEENAII